ncbi:MAG: SurA N-terminal domain-containing protein, partial [Mariprofundaceae bacterium]|nr:SurA N-terminal domain-containing protein [Mariprofundaceae bacterium]
MLESIRNQAQSWIAKLILGAVALSFVLWGVGDYFNSAGIQTVAEVDGTAISDIEFTLAYERQMNTYRSLLGKQFSKQAMESLGIRQETIQTLINRRLMLDEASRMGLVAPQDVLLATVRSNPSFQSSGSFDAQRYQVLTRNLGYRTPTDYEASLRLDLIADALQKAMTQSASVNEQAVRERFESEFEQREIAALIVEPSAMEKKIKIDDAQARAWYEAHKDAYFSPFRVSMNVVSIDPKTLAADMSIDEADIKAAYDEHQDRYVQPETRHARHILFALSKNADEAARKAARAKLDKALKSMKSGKSFASVAKKVSEDQATAKNGGDIGYLPQGATVSSFDAALFSMQKGEISDTVETQFGLHLIQLEDIKAEHIKTLDEVHDTLKNQLATERADEEGYKLSQDLDDALGREDSLKAAADSIGLKAVQYGPISIEEARGYPILGNASFRTQLFARQPGDPIEVNELDKGQFVAIEITRRDAPAEQSFEKVSSKVYADAKRAASIEQARKLAGEILAKASSTALDKLAQQHALPLYLTKPVRSNGTGDSDADWLSAEALQAAFMLNQGDVAADVIQTNKGFAVIQNRRIIAANAADFDTQRVTIRNELLRSEGAVRFA